MSPGDLLIATASLIALWLDFLDTGGMMDSGSSNGVGKGDSDSRPRGPSGEAWTEELFVVICADSGDMMGEACAELEFMDEALNVEAGIELYDEADVKEVCTWLGLRRGVDDDVEDRIGLGVDVYG